MTTNQNQTPFLRELVANIEAAIAEAIEDGTVGMSAQNLKQVTRTPKACEGAPTGTNARWLYTQAFFEALRLATIPEGFDVFLCSSAGTGFAY